MKRNKRMFGRKRLSGFSKLILSMLILLLTTNITACEYETTEDCNITSIAEESKEETVKKEAIPPYKETVKESIFRYETYNIEAIVENAYHKDMYVTPMLIGKITMFVTQPEVNQLTLRYNDESFVIQCNKSEYDNYCNKIGETISCRITESIYGGKSIGRSISLE